MQFDSLKPWWLFHDEVTLLHGTSEAYLPSILKDGLAPGRKNGHSSEGKATYCVSFPHPNASFYARPNAQDGGERDYLARIARELETGQKIPPRFPEARPAVLQINLPTDKLSQDYRSDQIFNAQFAMGIAANIDLNFGDGIVPYGMKLIDPFLLDNDIYLNELLKRTSRNTEEELSETIAPHYIKHIFIGDELDNFFPDRYDTRVIESRYFEAKRENPALGYLTWYHSQTALKNYLCVPRAWGFLDDLVDFLSNKNDIEEYIKIGKRPDSLKEFHAIWPHLPTRPSVNQDDSLASSTNMPQANSKPDP